MTVGLSPDNVATAAGLICEGKARLAISVYPWGVEFGLTSLRCAAGEAKGEK